MDLERAKTGIENNRQGRAGQGRAGRGGEGRAGQGWAGRAGQGRAGQGLPVPVMSAIQSSMNFRGSLSISPTLRMAPAPPCILHPQKALLWGLTCNNKTLMFIKPSSLTDTCSASIKTSQVCKRWQTPLYTLCFEAQQVIYWHVTHHVLGLILICYLS